MVKPDLPYIIHIFHLSLITPITLKALANFSPGFALKPWGPSVSILGGRNPDSSGLRPIFF